MNTMNIMRIRCKNSMNENEKQNEWQLYRDAKVLHRQSKLP